jgi:hypothetical protein
VAIVAVVALVWTAPVYFFWWKPRYGLGVVTMSQLRTGDCIDFGAREDRSSDQGMRVRRVKCSGAHYFEVTEVLDLDIQNTLVPETCAAAFERYVGLAPDDSTAWESSQIPVATAEGGMVADRSLCIVLGAGQLATTSARGTKR